MLEKTGAAIPGLFLLAVLSAGVLTVHDVGDTAVAPVEVAPTSDRPTLQPPAPRLPRITEPRAVLVLDVSGSLGVVRRPSDPEHLQALAALRFYDTYLAMAKEVLGQDGTARIAVVLMGTVAQTIDWDGQGTLFLAVSADDRALYEQVVLHYLGTPGRPSDEADPDPRRAQDSDYAAALDAVAELVTDAPSPPAVVFMTDGTTDPHPCFTPLIADAQRDGLRRCRGNTAAPTRLSAITRPPIFDRRAEDPPINRFAMPDTVDIERAVVARVRRLLARRFPVGEMGEAAAGRTAPLAWFPMYLEARARPGDREAVQAMLAPDPDGSLIACPTAGDMVREFVTALAQWFRMTALPLAPGETRFQVPTGTPMLTIQVESDVPLPSLKLTHGAREVALTGHGRFWGGVVTGECDGEWTFAAGRRAQLRASIFRRPRYEWVLSVPEVCAQVPQGPAPEAQLYLCRFSDGQAVAASEVFGELPATLPGSVEPAGGERQAVEFTLARDAAGTSPPTYAAPISAARLPLGDAMVSVELASLRAVDMSLSEDQLTRPFVIASYTRLFVRDARGRRSGEIRLDNVPEAPDWAWSLGERQP